VPTSADVADSNVPEVAQLAASGVGHRTGNVADVALADRDELVLGLLAAPELPTEVAEALAEDLPGLLAERVTDAVSWRVPVRTDPAAKGPAR
jgi:hypothetical protein